METSAFGVVHKSAQGTPEADHEAAHSRGEHAGAAKRYCPKCSGGWVSGGKTAGKIARKVG